MKRAAAAGHGRTSPPRARTSRIWLAAAFLLQAAEAQTRRPTPAAPGASAAKYPNPHAAPPPARIESDTGELRWLHADRKRGVVIVATPRSQSLIGFVRGSGESAPHLSADVTNDFSVLTLTSLDDQPIARAKTLLLVATTGAAVNTGQRFSEDGKTLAEWGQGPVLIEPVSGAITLRGLAGAESVKASPLTAEGRSPEPARPVERKGGDWSLSVGDRATTWWLVEVAR